MNGTDLVGTWHIVSWQKEFSAGERVDAQGPEPGGQIMYTGDGHFSAIVLAGSRAAPATLPASEADKVRLFDGMLAYAGTYSVEPDRVVHHVSASWNQSWTGTDQVRFGRIEGDRLLLDGAPAPDPYTGRQVVHRIVFRRA